MKAALFSIQSPDANVASNANVFSWMNVCVSCPFGRLLTFSSAQKMDSTALPLHLPTPWVEWPYQSSNLPAGEKWVASLWAVTQHLASFPCFVMLFIKLWFSLSTSLCQLVWLWQSCYSPVMYDEQHWFAIWVKCFLWLDHICSYLYSTSLHYLSVML